MIILDAEDQRRSKENSPAAGLTLRFPEKAVARSDSPLPDYETSEARQKFLLQSASEHRRLDGRLWRAILYALVIYVLLSAVIGVPIVLLKKKKLPATVDEPPLWDTGSAFGLSSAGLWSLGDTAGCGWLDLQEDQPHDIFTGSVQNNSSPSGSIFIRSNISCDTDGYGGLSGNLTVGMNPDSSATDIFFQVNITASSSELLRNTGACFNDLGSEPGLFLYATRNVTSYEYLGLNISVLFPHTALDTNLDNFITYLPGFRQTFGNLTDVYFKNLVIESAWQDIISTALAASRISAKNSFASIHGAFYASSSISLDSIKGDLVADIKLKGDPTALTATSLTLDTGDGEIDARVTLVAPTTSSFIADVKTFNGPLSLHVAHDPSTPSMPLQLSVQNNLAATNVFLDKKYEGQFSLQTKLNTVTVQQINATDPLRKGRSRSVRFDQSSPERVRGWVGWGIRPASTDALQGQVKIIAALSPVLLQLGSG